MIKRSFAIKMEQNVFIPQIFTKRSVSNVRHSGLFPIVQRWEIELN